MRQAQQDLEGPEATTEGQVEAKAAPPEPKDMSRLERLKLKIKQLQGKNPDIYPMF